MKKLLIACAITLGVDLVTTEIYFDARSIVLPPKPAEHHHFLPKCLKDGEEAAVWLKGKPRCVDLPVGEWRS